MKEEGDDSHCVGEGYEVGLSFFYLAVSGVRSCGSG